MSWNLNIVHSTNPDSLLNIVRSTPKDTSSYRAVNQLILKLYEVYPDSAYQLVQAVLPAAKRLNNRALLLDLYMSKGRIHNERAQYDSMLHVYEIARALAIELEDEISLAYTLNETGNAHVQKNQRALGLTYFRRSLAVATEKEDRHSRMRAFNSLGRTFSVTSVFDSADYYLNRALELEQEGGSIRLQAELLTNLANNAGRAGENEKSLDYTLRATEIFRQLNYIPGLVTTLRNLGVSYYFEGDFAKTIEYFQQALDVVEDTKYYNEWIATLDFFSEVYITLEDYEEALKYLEEASRIWKLGYGDKLNSDWSSKKGRVMLLKKDYEEAILLLRESLGLKKQLGQFVSSDLYWNMGQAYDFLAEPDSAYAYYQRAIDLARVSNDFLVLSQSLSAKGRIHEEAGQVNVALAAYQEALTAAVKIASREKEMDAVEGLYRTYKKQNRTGQALLYLEKSTALRDSLFNEENTREIARIESEYKFEKEKQALAFAQQQELEQQKNIRWLLYAALFVAGLVMLGGFMFVRAKQRSNAQLSQLNEALVTQKSVVEQQKEKLEKLDETKSKFFTNISHEFRTPLTIISGTIEQVRTNPDSWLERGGEMIKQNTLRLLKLVNQILDLSKLESNELKVQMVQGDIIKYLKYISSAFESLAQSKGITVHFLPIVPEVVMDYDPDKLFQIVSNLLSNAIKYSLEGSNVYLQLDKELKNQQTYFALRVQDTGIGIDENDLSNIFHRFYQVDDSLTRKVDGTGIGLALTKELVKLLGGEINVKSEVGVGSTFLVELPISNQAIISDEAFSGKNPSAYLPIDQSGTDELTPNRKKVDTPRLLIVEDNGDVRQLLVAFLEEEYDINIAKNGQEGIDKAVETSPDLIISDVMMPEKNGYELTETLKTDERTDHIPIILLTAKADQSSKITGLVKGADAYLKKPFDKKELLIRIEKLLELRKKLQARYANLSLSSKEEKIEDPFLEKVYTFIQVNLSDPDLDMNRMSRFLGMSRTQVFRKLKALTGKSPTAIIRSFRLQKGKELLSSSDFNISEVAYEVGFTSLNYFSKAYFEEFGVRPSVTRN